MKKITTELLEKARSMRKAWEAPSGQVGVVKDKDWILREIASTFGVDHVLLRKKLTKIKRKTRKRK